jgi:hypothetical protein
MTINDSPGQRYVPLLCWMIVLLAAGLICLKLLSFGFIPPGDARRHAAKPFAHKPYSEIVVMRPEYVVDHSPGWEWLLGTVQRATNCDIDTLICFSLVTTLLAVLCLPLFWVRRPEAWLAAIMAQSVAYPHLMGRWAQARPFLLTEGILMALLFSWSRQEERPVPWWKIGATTAGFTLSVWMHGAWYLWILLPAAFALARRWRAALWLTVCWVAGTILGACLTGKPVAFLNGAVFMARTIFQEAVPKWMLVGEFQPSTGEFMALTVLAVVYLWLRPVNTGCRALTRQPVFWMMLITWTLGLSADRFWADLGVAAATVWLAMQFDEAMPGLWKSSACLRLAGCGIIAASLYLISTNDAGRSYTSYQTEEFLDGSVPELKGWMPGSGGIFYSDNMTFFYNTFYKNPRADWRYILGFEPALMPEEDLKVYRNIQRHNHAADTYGPWVKKMRPQDRLAVDSFTLPDMPELEWKRTTGDLWIGRPRAAAGTSRRP